MCVLISMVLFMVINLQKWVYKGMEVVFCFKLKVFVWDSTETHY